MTKAWLAGGSGLVGSALLEQLLADPSFTEVLSVGRRSLPVPHPKLVQATVDFADPASFEPLDATDVAFSCLGTTIKKAGSKAAFRAVDFDAVLAFAKAAHGKGARTFVHVTSLGADPKSSQFYLSVKGEIEQAILAVGFDNVYVLRPSIIDGVRPERRPLERIGLAVARTLRPILGRYAPNTSSAIARMMIEKSKAPTPGPHIIEASEIR